MMENMSTSGTIMHGPSDFTSFQGYQSNSRRAAMLRLQVRFSVALRLLSSSRERSVGVGSRVKMRSAYLWQLRLMLIFC